MKIMTKQEVREGYIRHLEIKKRQKKNDVDTYCRLKSELLNRRSGKW